MSFQYSCSSSSTRYLGFEGDRPRQGPVKWSESQECSDSRRSARFSDHLKIKQDEGNCRTEFSPNSVTGHHGMSAVGPPPSPSPVCSPTNSFSPACSPRGTPFAHTHRHGQAYSTTEGSSGPSNRGKRAVGESNGEAVVAGPTSGRSDKSLATGNMYSNRESKPAPENPEDEDTDEVREIHMTEERSRPANTNNQIIRRPRQQNWSDTSMGSFISSDGESISLSTEFNNVLAAAAAAGTNTNSAQAAAESERLRSILEEVSPTRRPHLPGIGEEEPSRSDEGDQTESIFNRRERDNMALVLATDNDHTTSNNTAAHSETNRDHRGGRDYLALALVPMSGSHEYSGSNSDREAPMSSWDSQNNENEGSLVNHGDSSGERNGSTSSNSVRNRKEKGGQVATPKQLALAKVKRDKIEAKAVAWEEAKTAQVDNRFKREESIIMAWENEQKVKANINMKKVERKLEEKRAKAYEKMQNEIARAHRKAEERRAIAEAQKGAENAKIAEAVEKIRAFGRLPRKFLIF